MTVSDLRFGVHPDKIRMVMELSQVSEFKTFVIENPDRLIIDLPEFAWNVKTISKPRQSGVREVRQGRYQPGVSRIVVDVGQPAILRTAFIIPGTGSTKDRLVIDFEYVSPAVFAQKKTTVLGNLRTDGPSATKTAPTQSFNTASAAHPPATPQPVPTQKPRTKKPIIVIDPGHGGQDPGAVNKGKVFEKNVVLAAARELKRQLEATGLYEVRLTRDSDKFIKLHERVAMARKYGGDLFISLHADSINKSDVRGASIYTLSDKASDEQTARLAARENQADLIAGVDLSHEDKQVANILIDLAMRDTMNQSKFLANTLVGTLQAKGVKLLPGPHRYAGFAVLKAPDIPSVLIEIGFMSNEREVSMLNSEEYRQKIAGSLVDGINRYFAKVKHP